MTAVQEQLQAVTHQVLQLEKDGREKLKALTHDVTIFAVGHLIENLREKYALIGAGGCLSECVPAGCD